MTRKNTPKPCETIWANLLHLSFNMWLDCPSKAHEKKYTVGKPYLRFDMEMWDEALKRMVQAGMNMVVLDLGDGVKYESHPEIAVRRAWSPAKLKAQLERLRKMGLEPIPKLNFSTGHDYWLGPYARCVSTDAYYAVCRDLIEEVIELFDRPRLFHLGMDEETAHHQRNHEYVVIRQGQLWWHDLQFYVDQVEKSGVRAWVWSDYLWRHPRAFFKNMPKSVLQSNWYYGKSFSRKITAVQAYLELEKRGYDQIPTGSNWVYVENFPRTVAFCRRHVSPRRLLGFLQTPWKPTLNACRRRHLEAVDAVSAGMRTWARRPRRKS